MELREDKREINIEGDKIAITRTTTEVYDAEEYLRTMASLEFQAEQHKKAGEETVKILEALKEKKQEVESIRQKELEQVKKEVEKAKK